MQKGIILITGGTSGSGHELVNCFLNDNYIVYATGRELRKFTSPGEEFRFVKVDFSDFNDVKRTINELNANNVRFDIIINNAGVLSPPGFRLTGNELEYSFQVNFLSHLLLDELIIKEKKNADPLTIVSVLSPVYKFVKPDFKLPEPKGYSSLKAYAESKYYLLLSGDYLLNKYPEKNLKFIYYDPGTFSSGIYRTQKRWFRIMYHIAAPFMRNPSKVALILTKILQKQDLVSGAVYRDIDSYKIPDHFDKEVIKNFMAECHDQIESYVR